MSLFSFFLSLDHVQVIALIDVHHGHLIVETAETVDAVHVSDQGLETFIRHADNELQFQFPGVS